MPFFLIILFIAISAFGCKKDSIAPCGIGYKPQKFEEVVKRITSTTTPPAEKWIIQTNAEYENVYQQDTSFGMTMPKGIDFNNKTLLGGYVHYKDESNFGVKSSLCFNKKKKVYIYEINAKRRNTEEVYYPKVYWIITDKISSDYNIDIEINKK